MAAKKDSPGSVFLKNKKAYFEYEIVEELIAGIVLKGTEVKSLREGKASLTGAFARVENNEVFLFGMHISEYMHGNIHNHEPLRTRKLLLHKREIKRLIGTLAQKGYSCVPLSLSFQRGYAKIRLGVVKGKKLHDKRETIKKREFDRSVRDHS